MILNQPVEKIRIDQIRFSNETMVLNQDLKACIQKSGCIVPIVVRKAIGGKYEVLDGNSRLQIATDLGLQYISAIVLPAGEIVPMLVFY